MSAAAGRIVVRVETVEGAFALPLEATRGVLDPTGIQALPAPAPDVLGTLDHAGVAVPVLAAFGTGGAHVLLLEHDGVRFGVLVQRVTGVVRLTAAELEGPPAGQAEPLVAGIVRRTGAEALLLDPAILRRRLGAGPASG